MHSLRDWYQANENIMGDAANQRFDSNATKFAARRTVNETDNQTKWDKYLNDCRLDDRIVQIEQWRCELERVLGNADAEINLLARMKDDCDAALAAKAIPESCCAECIGLRGRRLEIDVVKDVVHDELCNEEKLIERVKETLAKRSQEAFTMIMSLKDAKRKVSDDLEGKHHALDINRQALGFNTGSSGLSYIQDLGRVAEGNSTPESWNAFSTKNRDECEEEIRASVQLRSLIESDIQNTANDLEAQRIACEYAFRNRIHEFEQTKSELEWQKTRTEEELREIEAEIRNVEHAITAKAGPQKVCFSRYELRAELPGIEHCKDEPAYGLHNELRELEKSLAALNIRLEEANNNRDRLCRTLATITHDLDLKLNSIRLDRQCLEVRKKLTIPLYRTPGIEPTMDTLTRTFA